MTSRTKIRASVADIVCIAENKLSHLYKSVQKGKATIDDFAEARVIVEGLPLTTSEYAQAKCRLENARRYYCLREKGAAAFELLSLGSNLNSAHFRSYRRRDYRCQECQQSDCLPLSKNMWLIRS